MAEEKAQSVSAAAVIFDLDGVLIDSERVWAEVLEQLASDTGGVWTAEAQQATNGLGSKEASAFMANILGFRGTPESIEAEYDRRIVARYRSELPEMPGARNAVQSLFEAGFIIGLASSSNRVLIDLALETMQITRFFTATAAGEDVAAGKPSPDVYEEACRRVGVSPNRCVAVEDSTNGIKSAHSAGLSVIAFPDADYPPDPATLELATFVLGSLDELAGRVAR